MSELSIRGDNSPALIPEAAAGLVEWAQAASAAHRLATGLVSTSFVPQAYRGKPDEAAAAMLAGSEVGLSPMASLRAFDNIQGTATPKAITIRAVMLRLGCEVEVVEQTSQRCIMRGRRTRDANWTEVKWDMDRARKMGLDKKQQWQNQPGAMLVARATSELGRLIAADALLGLGYTAEEVADDQPEPATKVTRRRAPQARPEPAEPSFDEPEVSSPEGDTTFVQATAERVEPRASIRPVDPPDGPITDAQSKKLHALLRECGITDREVGLAYISQIIDKEIGSTKELSKHDASRAIDQIEKEKEPAEPEPADGWPTPAAIPGTEQ